MVSPIAGDRVKPRMDKKGTLARDRAGERQALLVALCHIWFLLSEYQSKLGCFMSIERQLYLPGVSLKFTLRPSPEWKARFAWF